MPFDQKKFIESLDTSAGGVFHLIVSHDESCPAIHSGIGCNCEPHEEIVNEQEFIERVTMNRAQRRAQAKNKGGA